MTKLYLMCGVAGCGKSTWIHNAMEYNGGIHISRDAIRFSMVKENENYFKAEKKVFNQFVKTINEFIGKANVVYADATHLNEISRNKLLDKLNLENVEVIPVNFLISLEECLRRNALRSGRACVPANTIKDMYNRFTPATYDEKYTYKHIITVNE